MPVLSRDIFPLKKWKQQREISHFTLSKIHICGWRCSYYICSHWNSKEHLQDVKMTKTDPTGDENFLVQFLNTFLQDSIWHTNHQNLERMNSEWIGDRRRVWRDLSRSALKSKSNVVKGSTHLRMAKPTWDYISTVFKGLIDLIVTSLWRFRTLPIRGNANNSHNKSRLTFNSYVIVFEFLPWLVLEYKKIIYTYIYELHEWMPMWRKCH